MFSKGSFFKVIKSRKSIFSFFYARQRRDVLCYHPWRMGGVPHSLSGAYLQDYASYGYETSWVDRSHQGGVQCTGTITFTCLIFELLPFVYFHTWILSGAYLQNYTSYGYEILWVDRSHQGGVQGTWTITLVCFFFLVIALCLFSYLTFVRNILYFCPKHISKTVLSMVIKFCGWIDLIKGECSAHEL